MKRFAAGDPLRALAALSVLIYHAGYATMLMTHTTYDAAYGVWLAPILSNLDLGLYIFFVLSGYLIAGPFVHWVLGQAERPVVTDYLRNRMLRIVPAFWVVYTVLLLRHVLLPDLYAPGTFAAGGPTGIAAVYLFGQNFHPSSSAALILQAWTLDVEVTFYLLVPLLFAGLSRVVPSSLGLGGRTLLLLAVTLVLGTGSVAFHLLTPPLPVWQRSLPTMLFAFIPGLLLATVEPWVRAHVGRRSGAALSLGVLAAALGLLLGYHAMAPEALNFVPRTPPLRILLAALGTGGLVGAALIWEWSGRRAPRALDNNVLRWTGKRSYSIYLIHAGVGFDLGWLVSRGSAPLPSFVLFASVVLAITLVLAQLNYRLVELPFLRLKGRPGAPHPTSPRERGEELLGVTNG